MLLALSGGVDSSVVAALLVQAIGSQLTCVHVNHGLMRKGESEAVIEVFQTSSTRTSYTWTQPNVSLQSLRGYPTRNRSVNHRRGVYPRI